MSRLWKLFCSPEPRIENWLSSARPNRGRISTPGTKSSTPRRFSPSDSMIVVSPMTSTPPGTVRWISWRASSVVAVRSGVTRAPSTTTGVKVGGGSREVGVWAAAEVASNPSPIVISNRIDAPPVVARHDARTGTR